VSVEAWADTSKVQNKNRIMAEKSETLYLTLIL
jgi:hypothetical protein